MEMLNALEEEVLREISAEEAWGHVEYLSTLDKTSGTEGERKAHEYVRERLREYGIPFKTYEFDSLISHPKKASLRVVSPSTIELECITHSFSGQTPEGGLEAGLIHVEVPPGTLHRGLEGLVEEYERAGAKGKAVVVWGVASPATVLAAQLSGALAQINISGEDILHEMIVTSVWGTPTPESSLRIPRIPVVSVKRMDGELLLQLLKGGDVRVKLEARVDTRWRRIPITVAEISGVEEPERFMLVHGHMDSWYLGATDNCTGNAACLELARVLWKHRNRLKRSVRIAWWSGHSTGRYSASTWYADNNFEDLDENCFLTMNVDSPGVKGASKLTGGGLMGTLRFVEMIIKDSVGVDDVEVRSYAMRAGDQSFYGIGIPSIAVGAAIPEGSPLRGAWIGGSGGGWWWHSAYDTIDKADRGNLHRDLRMITLAVFRSVNLPILPFDFSMVAEEYERAIAEIQTRAASGTFNLLPLLDRVRELGARAERLKEATGQLCEADGEAAREVNRYLMRASRLLTSTLYTYKGRYDQDPAYGIPVLPALREAERLSILDPESSEARFLKTMLVRNMNMVRDKLKEAIEALDEAYRKASRAGKEKMGL
ncbi:M28 family peptidase [Candidatus Bathyarchaeota archaeon]|nr:M28 family peptidase [Candidatus Bathyarchaeota archaeon]